MSRFVMCPECGYRMSRVKDMSGNWDGETYRCDYCAAEYDGDDEEDDGEYISVWDAANIWQSSGRDEDNMFGYTEEELEKALK